MALALDGFSTVSSNAALSLDHPQVSVSLRFMLTAVAHSDFLLVPTGGSISPGIVINAGTDISFWYSWTGGDGVWFFGTVTLSVWYAIGIRYDRGSAANDPSGRLNGVTATVGEVLTPSGTVITPGPGYQIGGGNVPSGRIEHVQVFDRLLTDREFDATHHRPGSIRNGLRLWRPCWDANSTEDLSGNGGHGTTNTGMGTAKGGPAGPLFGSRTGRQWAATLAATGQATRTAYHRRRRVS